MNEYKNFTILHLHDVDKLNEWMNESIIYDINILLFLLRSITAQYLLLVLFKRRTI